MTIDDAALMTAILPVVYVLVDLIRPVPGVRDWTLPIIAAFLGCALGATWALAGGDRDGQSLMLHAVVGFSFGAGATGLNQVKSQTKGRVEGGQPVTDEHRRSTY